MTTVKSPAGTSSSTTFFALFASWYVSPGCEVSVSFPPPTDSASGTGLRTVQSGPSAAPSNVSTHAPSGRSGSAAAAGSDVASATVPTTPATRATATDRRRAGLRRGVGRDG
ncbi:Uncharacterised protein [Mycobacteroides abscessus]|nr:Uncharacterised protein [Mycobacteroides abscessus]